MQIREGLYYNPYFVGGAIAMPKMLADEGAEYDDGTVATEAQQAKVSCSDGTALVPTCAVCSLCRLFTCYLSNLICKQTKFAALQRH